MDLMVERSDKIDAKRWEIDMPEGTKVDRCFKKLKRQGKSAGSAARICQSSTGQALATGRAPKRSGKRGRGRK
jgi:hypothetical protein